MAYKDPEVGRACDRERFCKRVAERRAQGLCPRCGTAPPAPGRSVCEPCAEKKRVASCARDAKLRAAGKPRRDLDKARAYGRTHSRRQTAERLAQGLCPRCGERPHEPERHLCAPCGEQRRTAERARYAKARAAGKLYGGRDPEGRRRIAKERSKQRFHARRNAGLCTRCGKPPAVEGSSTCEPCLELRREAEREIYASRRVAGKCTKCGESTFNGAARCAFCVVNQSRCRDRKNAANRRRYAERRTQGLCTDCNQPSQGAARCEPCAKRSYFRSNHFRGLPLYPPSYTIIELATGEDHGTYDSEAEVGMCLAFAKLSRDQVEVLVDQSPMQIISAWE